MSLSSTVAQRLAASLEFEDEQERAGNTISNPKIVSIAQFLEANPLLVEPCLRWLNQKNAEMNAAQLSVLYTPAELDELRKKWEIT